MGVGTSKECLRESLPFVPTYVSLDCTISMSV